MITTCTICASLPLRSEIDHQFDLAADLDRALHSVRAKQLGPDWTDVCRTALWAFRCSLWYFGEIAVQYAPCLSYPKSKTPPVT